MKRPAIILPGLIILLVFLTGCDRVWTEVKPTVRTFPTLTPKILATATMTPTSTPTVTPILPARRETPALTPPEMIQPANSHRLVVYGERGNGLATQLDWSPAGSQFAISTTRGVYLFDRELQLVNVFKTEKAVQAIAFSPDGSLLAGGLADGNILVWEVASTEIVQQMYIKEVIWLALAFSPDGEQLASAGWHEPLTVWSIKNGSLLSRISAHDSGVKSLAYSSDGAQLFSWGRTEPVWITPVDGKAAARNISMRKDSLGFRPVRIKFSPAGNTFLAIYTRQVSLLTTDRGYYLITLSDFKEPLLDAALSPDETTIATVERNLVRLWNSQTGIMTRELGQPPPGDSRTRLEFSPDGKYLLVAGNTIQLWSLEDATDPAENPELTFTADYHLASKATADGHGVLSLLIDGSIVESDLISGVQRSFSNPINEITSPSRAFTPERIAWRAAEGKITVMDFRTGEVILEVSKPKKDLSRVALSEDGATLAILAQSGMVEILNTAGGESLSSFEIEGIPRSGKFSPDGRMYLIQTDTGLQVWQTNPPRLTGSYAGFRGEFSPDGSLLAVAAGEGADQYIHIWDMVSQKKTASFRVEGTSSLAFAPDASILALSGSHINLYQLPEGERLTQIPLEGLPVNGDVFFTPGGETLVYADMDGSLRFWGIQ